MGIERKASQILDKDKDKDRKLRKQRVPTLERVKKPKKSVEDDLKGWDVPEGPQFFDY